MLQFFVLDRVGQKLTNKKFLMIVAVWQLFIVYQSDLSSAFVTFLKQNSPTQLKQRNREKQRLALNLEKDREDNK